MNRSQAYVLERASLGPFEPPARYLAAVSVLAKRELVTWNGKRVTVTDDGRREFVSPKARKAFT